MPSKRRRVLRRAVSAALLALIAAGFVTGWWLRVRELRIPVGLPTPVRLAVMSDIHLSRGGGGVGMAQRAVRETMRRRPDAIVLVGDFVSGEGGIRYIAPTLAGLRAPLGVYAVLGNHDHWADAQGVRAALGSAGIRVLVNDSVILRKGRTRLALVGIDDLWAGSVDWRAAWRRVPKAIPVVLLSHNPDAAIDRAGQRATLILSGHTHGGKVLLPRWLLPLLRKYAHFSPVPASGYGEQHLYGLVREKWGWVYITSGVAAGFSPPRWFTRPEIAVLELQ